MKFDRSRVSFGRHQTFAVRYGWLSKGFQAIKRDPNILRAEDAIAELGVGKNMVESISFWLRAFQLVDEVSVKPTELGNKLFSARGYDPFLEDEATIWLLHWLLCSNPYQATSWYWFFNKFHKTEFTNDEIATALTDFVKENVREDKQPSSKTLKTDAGLLTRMYTTTASNAKSPIEESLDSPLSQLRLIEATPKDRLFVSRPIHRSSIPAAIIGFAITQRFAESQVEVLPIEDLMYARAEIPAVGAIFRLTEQGLLAKIEELVERYPSLMKVSETAGVHQVYLLDKCEPLELLEHHYASFTRGVAA